MEYAEILKQIGISEEDCQPELLDRVFIHRSYVNEHRKKGIRSNERLEFLGDAVLELVTTEYLFRNFDNPEGDLTNWRSALVKKPTLSAVATSLGLGKYLKLSHGEDKSGGREKDYLLANTVEALIGYIYLVGGYAKAELFIHKAIIIKLQEILENNLHIDAKSHFQESAQEKLGITPNYKVLKEEGPDHLKTFTMGVYLDDELIGEGKGNSKQEAEQSAARDGLEKKQWIINQSSKEN